MLGEIENSVLNMAGGNSYSSVYEIFSSILNHENFTVKCNENILKIYLNNNPQYKNCCVDNEIIFGYPTGKYSILSVLVGLIGFYNAYSVLNNTYNAIFLVIITVIFQLILLFPDIVNKYLPVDIKLKKYFLLFILILILIFLIIGSTFKDNMIFNLNVFSFIKVTFIIVLSLIISKWYLKKIK